MTYEISSARTTVEMSRFLFIYLTNETSIIMLVGQHYMCTDMKLIVQHTYLRSGTNCGSDIIIMSSKT